MFNNKAQTELIPMIMYLFIVTAFVFTLVFVIPPAFKIVEELDAAADSSGSIYYDVPAKFDVGVKAWYFILVLIVGKILIHMGLIAHRKQRRTGERFDESDF